MRHYKSLPHKLKSFDSLFSFTEENQDKFKIYRGSAAETIKLIEMIDE